MATILLKNATLVTLSRRTPIVREGAVAVQGERIVRVGSSDSVVNDFRNSEYVIDAKGGVVLPGLVNMHTHMFQALLRGLGDDMALMDWIRKMLYRYAPKLNARSIRAGADLSCVEMIRTGVTTVVDNHHINTSAEMVENVCDSILASGIRGVVARGMRVQNEGSKRLGIQERFYEFGEDEEIRLTEILVKKWRTNPRVKVCPAPVTIFSSTLRLLSEAKRISEENSVPFHIHIAESPDEVSSTKKRFGCREVELLARERLLGSRTHVVHGVWLDNREIGLLSKSKSNVVHCPVSNMYLSSGIARIRDLMRANINVCLGTDGPASNNSHDMFEVMKTAALLSKVSTRDPRSLTAHKALSMATVGGATALGLNSEIGTIKEGKRADLVVVDLHRPYTAPAHNPVSACVYTATHSDVVSVVADGRPLMLDGKLTELDEEKIVSNAEEAVRDAGIAHGDVSILNKPKK